MLFMKNILRSFAAGFRIMFYLLQKDLRFQIFVLLALTGLFCLQLFAAPVAFCLYDPALPYALSLDEWMAQNQTVAQIGILVLYVLQQLIIYNYFKKNRFADDETLIPCIALAAFMVVGGTATHCTPVFIANTAIIGLLRLSDDSESRHLKSRLLVAGALVGIASLYDITLLLLAVAVILILVTNRLNNLTDIFVALIGILVPYIYVVAYHFFVGNLTDYLASFSSISLQFPLFATRPSLVSIVCIVVCIALLIFILLKLKVRFDYKLIVIRKRFGNIHFLFIVSAAILFLTNLPFPQSLGYLFVPIALYIAAYAPSRRFSISKEVVLTLFLTAITLIGIGL